MVLQIHLPREVTVPTGLLTLGQISVVRGDGALVAAASRIGMGRLSVPGQKARLDRPTILSRLASSGIPTRNVRLTGADAVLVRRDQKLIRGDEFLDLGQTFLEQHPPGPAVCEVAPAVRPKDLVLPAEAADLQLTPRFVRNKARGHVTVQVVVTAAGREIGTRDIPFRLKYQCHRAVTVQEIAAGQTLTPENVKIETVAADQPEPAGWQPPYGLVALRQLARDTEIRKELLAPVPAPIVVRRNEAVVLRLERPGLLVTASGIALQEGRAGDVVKVRNADSSRTIVGKVNADGTVEPML